MIGDGMHAGRGDTRVPGLVILQRRRPGDVVDRARRRRGRARPAARRTRRARRVSGHALPRCSSPAGTKPERLLEQSAGSTFGEPRVRMHRVEALQRDARPESRDAPRGAARRRRRDDEPVAEPSGSSNVSAGVVACRLRLRARKPRLPEVERLAPSRRATAPCAPSRAGSAAPDARVLEERDVAARRSVLVRVEEVVDGRVVLVDRLLHEPQPENARVEVDVSRRVAGDARHVMDAVERHRGPSVAGGR